MEGGRQATPETVKELISLTKNNTIQSNVPFSQLLELDGDSSLAFPFRTGRGPSDRPMDGGGGRRPCGRGGGGEGRHHRSGVGGGGGGAAGLEDKCGSCK